MKSLRSIRQLNSTTSYPFLFHVFDDYKRGIIDLDTLEKVLQFLFSYLLRRSVCGIPTNSLRGLFTYLYSRVFKVKGNKEKYYPAINKFLCTLMTKDAMPTDVEFEQALKQTNIYRNAALCKFILMDIENGGGKETLDINSLTIEHIMPQTLNLEWKHISEENHKQYLHVLGNLSVSGYNSELSNRSFDEKKKIIRENSKAVVLNNDVWDKNIWDINCIVKRGERLAEIIMKHYPIECIQDDSINFEYISTITLDDYSYVTGKKLVNFKFEDNIYIQNTYAMMLVDMIRLLDKINPTLLGILADHDFSYAGTKSLPRISYHVDTLRLPTLLRDGIYVDLNLSAKAIMRFIEILLEKYNIPKDSFSISVVAEDKMN